MSWNGRFGPGRALAPDDQDDPGPAQSSEPDINTLLEIFPTTKKMAMAALSLADANVMEAINLLIDDEEAIATHAQELDENGFFASSPTANESGAQNEGQVANDLEPGESFESGERPGVNADSTSNKSEGRNKSKTGQKSKEASSKPSREDDRDSDSHESDTRENPADSDSTHGAADEESDSSSDSDGGDEEEENEKEISDTASISTKVRYLQKLFPDASESEVENSLQAYDNDVDETIEALEEDYHNIVTGRGPTGDARGSDEAGPSGTAHLGNGLGDRKPAATGDKRQAESDNDDLSPSKKARVYSMSPAENWVLDHFGQYDGGVTVILKEGVHPRKFPKLTLWTNFTLFKLPEHFGPAENFDEENTTLQLKEITRETFDLAIQWIKKIKEALEKKKTNKTFDPNEINKAVDPKEIKGAEITVVLELLAFGERYGLEGLGASMAKHLKLILQEDRRVNRDEPVLTSEQILSAYALSIAYDRKIQRLFVEAAARPYLEFKKDKTQIDEDVPLVKDLKKLKPAHQKSILRHQFRYRDALNSNICFANDLNELAMDVWHSREEEKRNTRSLDPKNKYIYYCFDPLTGEKFYAA
ncbi:hypothetical protein G7Y89_g6783 [Cudoniella acicularis]|uniref:CUE domain-containing protein n=1 Tax=Cudoniella acicularis TaxID=354080 RepID=A0A8H4RLA8_9HELO|nr:hypothetical protein G7Y89_g6783 [Cudoniella acicularis]